MPQGSQNPEVVVVGGGPAGANCARILAENSMTVTIIDKHPKPSEGTPWRDKACGGSVSYATWEAVGIANYEKIREMAERCMGEEIFGVVVNSPSDRFQARYDTRTEKQPPPMSFSLRRKYWDAELLMNALNHGVQYMTGQVRNISPGQDDMHVNFSDSRAIKTKMVVDASGAASKLMLQSNDNNRNRYLIAFTVETVVDHDFEGIKHYYCGNSGTETVGYGWIFPKGRDSKGKGWVNIGFGWRLGQETNMKAEQKHYIERMERDFPKLKRNGLKERRFVGHRIPLGVRWEDIVRDRMLVVGDAGGFVKPNTGSGLHLGAVSSACAARTIIGLKRAKREYTKDNLEIYREQLREKLSPFLVRPMKLEKVNEVERIVAKLATIPEFNRLCQVFLGNDVKPLYDQLPVHAKIQAALLSLKLRLGFL